MATEPTLGQRPPLLLGLTLVMLVFVTLVGGVFGFFAVIVYYDQGPDVRDLGVAWGLGAAAVSGLVWRWLLHARCRSRGLDRLNRYPAWMGLAAGLADCSARRSRAG